MLLASLPYFIVMSSHRLISSGVVTLKCKALLLQFPVKLESS